MINSKYSYVSIHFRGFILRNVGFIKSIQKTIFLVELAENKCVLCHSRYCITILSLFNIILFRENFFSTAVCRKFSRSRPRSNLRMRPYDGSDNAENMKTGIISS